jgi:quinol monooxygenase YgiN
MVTSIVKLQVADFDTWKREFDIVEQARKEHGYIKHEVFRTLDDPNAIVIVNHVSSMEDAKAYFANQSVKDAVARSGVQGPPTVWFLEQIEAKEY